MTVAGYAHPRYAASFAELGEVRELPASGGWVIERPIGAASDRDAMSPYPLLAVREWRRLGDDLARLSGRLVSVTAVCDPFGDYTTQDLAAAFDVVRPFKTHVIVDLRRLAPSRHHRRSVRDALRRVRVEEVAEPAALLDEWCALYDELIRRHGLRGLHRFSRRSFAAQLAVPGVRAFRARWDGRTVAAQLWYVANGRAYGHLHAAAPRGYEVGAAYALFAEAFDALRAEAEVATIGGAAGTDAPDDPLLRFKRGWSRGTIVVPLVGRILDRIAYERLAGPRPVTTYFPAYRAGEFVAEGRADA